MRTALNSAMVALWAVLILAAFHLPHPYSVLVFVLAFVIPAAGLVAIDVRMDTREARIRG